jgi:vancomycin permeability regulator SanA
MEDENTSVAIVTNGFHIFRSVSIAKKQGLSQAQGLAAPSDQILTLNYYVREVVGVLKDFVFGNI